MAPTDQTARQVPWQIAGAVFFPLALLGWWLASIGFFQPPAG